MQTTDFTEDMPGELVRNLSGDWCFIPAPLPGELAWTGELVSILSAADRAIGELRGIGMRLPNPALLARSFLRREAELSSRIEGTQANLEELVLFDQTQAIEQRAPDVREVDNNFRALEWGLGQVNHRPISLNLIRQMHQMLLQGTRGEDKMPGVFRTVQAHIGPTLRIAEATYVPPPPHAIAPAMEELERFIQSPSALPPLVRVAMLHYQFEAIHPFADGNGRIGRVLILLLLGAERTLPVPLLNPSAFMERNRSQYYAHLLSVEQRGAWNDWVTFFLRGMAQEAADATERVEKLNRLHDQYQSRVRAPRMSALLPKLVDELFINPAVTTARAAQLLDVTAGSAQKTIDKLLSIGILHEVTGQKRNRVYLANNILATIQGKEKR